MFYLLHKPKGVSSFQAIQDFARSNRQIHKIGHTGTLDPLASGLLLVATNEDTRLIEYVDTGWKTYFVQVELGKVSDTYDVTGKVTLTHKTIPSQAVITKKLCAFVGKQQQAPPAFSAKKVGGKRAYALSRQNQKVSLKPTEVEVKKVSDICFDARLNILTFTTEVSRGTYIRSIVHDLGQKLGCGAIMTNLARTSIGNLSLKEANTQIRPQRIMTTPVVSLGKRRLTDLKNGRKVRVNRANGKYALKYKREILGVIKVQAKEARVEKLLGAKLVKVGG